MSYTVPDLDAAVIDAIDPHTGQLVTFSTFSFSHSVNLEKMESV